ncbi:HlyD family secretion protein [Vibrio breoganii]|uniref:HlyD family secretion protein n=1 Tax=Vibrio breoganii TaxID=553239 RepID=UPI000C867904|nr:HlyD family secretion protein [Vibrio breoganii]PMF97026.1 secretion protein [Vibrio breoganii]PMG06547.1 secretion protein [Vibrio breoganii]PMI23006.1 secretion protein [Vibrio breoganii]PMK28078.1 secretion protein [Vibrio breoganii]PMK60623.1 secretion protein [Vibrio breoganii]
MSDNKENQTEAEKTQPEAEAQPAAEKEAAQAPETPAEETHDPVKKITRNVFIVVGLIFVWYLFADRHTPWTDEARVQAYVIPIIPQVSGKILEVNVAQDDVIERGSQLFRIDPADYELSVELAESELEIAGQEIGAGMASVVTAQAGLVEAQTNLEHVNVQSARVFELEQRKLYSKSDGDKARAAIKQAKAQVRSAEANLDKAKQSLGPEGAANPRVRTAVAKLKQTQLDLSRTRVLAPTNGGITNLQVDVGYYANPGAPVMTFIDADDSWIEANLKENNLANLKIGDPVDISLDITPGKIYKGKVRSIGFAVASGSTDAVGGLVTVKSGSGWLRDPQRFPVVISFDEELPKGLRRVGGQADVQFYTSDNFILNGIAKVYIRLLSWISYVY